MPDEWSASPVLARPASAAPAGLVTVTRCEIARQVRRAHLAVGSDLVDLNSVGNADRGHGRPLLVIELVNAVCLEGRSIRSVIKAAGWPVTNSNRDAAGKALHQAIDRTQRVIG